jgi:DNA-binding CsgD family transcriptional regulator
LAKPPKSRYGLTKREIECLYGCGQGKTNAQIAKALGLSARTVEHYLASAVRKLDAKNRTEAVYLATRAGLLDTVERSAPRGKIA